LFAFSDARKNGGVFDTANPGEPGIVPASVLKFPGLQIAGAGRHGITILRIFEILGIDKKKKVCYNNTI